MRLVSDTGPLIALAQVEQLELLASFFEEVLIPPAVEAEVLAKATPETELLRKAVDSWIRAVDLQPPSAGAASRLGHLDRGEREAILLAYQMDCLLLIDDRAGRAAARALAVPITGIAGFLLMAKKRGAIPAVLPLLEEMRQRGYWLSKELLQLVGKLAGETSSVE